MNKKVFLLLVIAMFAIVSVSAVSAADSSQATNTTDYSNNLFTDNNNQVNDVENSADTANVASADNVNNGSVLGDPVDPASGTITADSVDYPNDAAVTVTVTGDGTNTPTGSVTVIATKDGTQVDTQTGTLTDGQATVTFSGLAAGTYTLTGTYEGDTNYNQLTLSEGSLTISQVAPTVTITDPADGTYGSQSTIEVTVSGVTDGATPTGNVTVTVNGTEYNATLTDGVATVDLGVLPVGDYTVTAKYNGDDNYKVADAAETADFTISQAAPTVTITDPADGTYGSQSTIEVTVAGVDGYVPTGNVTVTVNGTEYNGTLTDGVATVTVDVLPAGDYTVTAKYNGDNNYSAADAAETADFTISQAAPTVTITEPETGNTAENSTIYVNVTGVENGAVPTGKVTVKVNDKEYTADLDSEGVATVTLDVLPEGTYDVTASYAGDGNYTTADAETATLTIEDATAISSEDLTMYYKNGKYTAVVTGTDGNPESDVNVTITIAGKTYNRVTDENGAVNLTINLKPGTYDVVAIDTRNNNSVSTTVTVLPRVVADNLTLYYKNGSAYTVQVLDGEGNPVANHSVAISFAKKTYNRVTDENGYANLTINLKPGNYTVSTKDSNTSEVVENNIVVLPRLASDNIELYYKNGSAYTVQVLDGEGNPVANQSVAFTFARKTYYRTTDENGYANLTINLKPGTYTVTAKNTATNETVKNTITVLKTLKTTNLNMEYKDGSKFNATVLDGQGNALSGVNVTFSIAGKKYVRLTDENGVAKLNINLKAGKYSITSTYNGLTNKNTIKISS